MQEMFFRIVGISITTSLLAVILLCLSSIVNERYKAKWRYVLWFIIAVRLVIPIDFGLTEPPLVIHLPDAHIESVVSNKVPDESKQAADPAAGNRNLTEEKQNAGHGSSKPESGSSPGVNTGIPSALNPTAHSKLTIAGLLSAVYFLGAAVFFAAQIVLYLSFKRSIRPWRRKAMSAQVLVIYHALADEMEITKEPRLEICKKVASPMILGILRPMLLLPHEAYSEDDLALILKHELIHYKRKDLWFKLLLTAACGIHWFNPIIHMAVKRASHDIEISCDEEALKGADMADRKLYSQRILELIEIDDHSRARGAGISTCFCGGAKMMKARMENIFDMREKKRGITVLCAACAVILIFSACSVSLKETLLPFPITTDAGDAYAGPGSVKGKDGRSKVNLSVSVKPYADQGKLDFKLDVSEKGETCLLRVQQEGNKGMQTLSQVMAFYGEKPGTRYSIEAADWGGGGAVSILLSMEEPGEPLRGSRQLYRF